MPRHVAAVKLGTLLSLSPLPVKNEGIIFAGFRLSPARFDGTSFNSFFVFSPRKPSLFEYVNWRISPRDIFSRKNMYIRLVDFRRCNYSRCMLLRIFCTLVSSREAAGFEFLSHISYISSRQLLDRGFSPWNCNNAYLSPYTHFRHFNPYINTYNIHTYV